MEQFEKRLNFNQIRYAQPLIGLIELLVDFKAIHTLFRKSDTWVLIFT